MSLRRLVLFVCMLLPLATGNWAAAADPELRLLRPDSLAGWDHGVPPRGWAIAEGKFHGTADSTPLLSGWTMGDFTLSLRWSVERQGILVLDLPDVPAGAGMRLQLTEQTPGGSLIDRGQILSAGGAASPTADGWHIVRIERNDRRLTVQLDDRPWGAVELAAARRFGLGLSVLAGEATVADARLSEPAGESIFNGRNLDGWWSPFGLTSWRAKPGVLECLNKDGNYLRSEKLYGNFTLSLQYKQAPHCNSGIGIRTPRDGWPSGDGMELQLIDEPGLHKDSTMAIYRNLEPLGRADRAEVWNTAVIKADGRMISAWVNGELVQQANTLFHPELKHRHLRGWIGFQDHGGQVDFRDIRVLQAPDGHGLDAWCAPRTASGPEIVLERLINPAAMSLDDGISSESIVASVRGGEQTLAELTGPGAVLQIGCSQPTGRLLFFFDGQSQPAIECPADRLHEYVPVVAEQLQPLLTCLPFVKSLRIVHREAAAADYRLEYAKFPPGMPVETFAPQAPVLPRGWLAAIDYRAHQYGWGIHREEDPAPRHSGEVKSLEPGQSTALVRLEGAGIVQWLKLEADPAVLRGDNLQFDVQVDGEPQSAIAAPAKYFFPALSGTVPVVGGPANHYNFLNVYRNGFTNMLAMPFARGLTVSVSNKGTQALGKIRIVASVLRDDPLVGAAERLQLDRRLRLRGRFDSRPDTLSASGRWVAVVWSSENNPPGSFEMAVDGRKQPGWQSSADGFLGAAAGERTFFHLLAGRSEGLAWRYLLLTPVDFHSSLQVTLTEPLKNRLVLWYQR